MSSASQNTDFVNVHSKRKKEETNLTSNGQSNAATTNKKYKLSTAAANDASPPEALPNTYNSNTKKPSCDMEEWLWMFKNWSHNERILALDSLVNSKICEFQQLRHLLAIVEPQLQRDFISLLPKELSLYVLSFLDPPDLLRAAQTCRCWRILCEDNLLWREKCREEGLLEDHEALSDLFSVRISLSKTFDRKIFKSEAASASNSPEIRPLYGYKSAYLHHKNIEFNWRHGILNYSSNSENSPTFANQSDNPLPENIQSCANNHRPARSDSESPTCLENKPRKLKRVLRLKGHEDNVITCLQFNPTSNIIVSGSDDNTLKVWSSTTGRCIRTLVGHTGGVWSSQLSNDNIVISGSTDRTLRVWNALNGHCLHTLYGHTSTVRCMALYEKHVVSGSRDATLRVWNIETGECVHVLVGHVAAVRCVQFNGVLCVSGAYDYLVKVWDVASETCLHTLEGHTNRVYSLQFDGKHIVSGSLDTSIRVWCAESGRLKHTLIGHQSLTSGMQLRNNILVSGNADSTVRVWDIKTGQCLQTLSGANKHQSAVTCLQFNSKFVITSSDDGTVKLWDLKTGEFIRNLVALASGGSGGVVWRIRASNTKLVCAVGSRNGTEETKLLVLDFETPNSNHGIESLKTTLSCDFQDHSSSSPTYCEDNGNQFSVSNSSSSDSLNRLSSFCNNCQHVYGAKYSSFRFPDENSQNLTALEQRQQESHSNNALPPSDTNPAPVSKAESCASATTTISSSTSTSAYSSLATTPSSSNLVLSSISSTSSLQSISSSFRLPKVIAEVNGTKIESSPIHETRISQSSMKMNLEEPEDDDPNFMNIV